MKNIIRNQIAVAVAGLALAVFGDIAAVTPSVPDAEWTKNWWMKRHEEKMALVKAGGAQVVFIGDSITHMWETRGKMQWDRTFAEGPRKALNLGFSGDRTEHVLWRIDHGELDGYEAKVVLLMIGTNNTGHKSFDEEPPVDTILGVRAVIDRIREKQPKAKIVLTAILPRGKTAEDPLRRRNDVVNHEIMRFADGKNVFWCDFGDQLLTTDGFLSAEVMPDRLHPGDYGYEVWTAAVLPYIDAALEGRTMPPNRYGSRIDSNFYREGPKPTQAISLIGRREHWWKDPELWFHALQRQRREASEGDGEFDAVFFGDSITSHWNMSRNGAKVLAELRETYKVHVLGIGGDCVQHNIWRARYGELNGYKAKLIVLMIGTNNNYGDKPADTAAGVKVLLGEIREKQPQAKILLCAIFPRGETAADEKRRRNDEVNRIIQGYADGKDILWLDIRQKLMNADGTIDKELMPDYLHPLEKGYRIWADELRPYLAEICGKAPAR